jgi:hypothetical protein
MESNDPTTGVRTTDADCAAAPITGRRVCWASWRSAVPGGGTVATTALMAFTTTGATTGVMSLRVVWAEAGIAATEERTGCVMAREGWLGRFPLAPGKTAAPAGCESSVERITAQQKPPITPMKSTTTRQGFVKMARLVHCGAATSS